MRVEIRWDVTLRPTGQKPNGTKLNYSKALSNQRRIEFRKANKPGKELLKGTHYLVLKNADKLNDMQRQKLQKLLVKFEYHVVY